MSRRIKDRLQLPAQQNVTADAIDHSRKRGVCGSAGHVTFAPRQFRGDPVTAIARREQEPAMDFPAVPKHVACEDGEQLQCARCDVGLRAPPAIRYLLRIVYTAAAQAMVDTAEAQVLIAHSVYRFPGMPPIPPVKIPTGQK